MGYFMVSNRISYLVQDYAWLFLLVWYSLSATPLYSDTLDPVVASSTTPKIERQISCQVYGKRYSNDILHGVK